MYRLKIECTVQQFWKGCRWLGPETHFKRQVSQHDCLPSLLGDGGKCVEGENILYWADKSSQGSSGIFCTDTTGPTNQTKKDPFHLYSLSSHLNQFQQSGRATPLQYLWLGNPTVKYIYEVFWCILDTKKLKTRQRLEVHTSWEDQTLHCHILVERAVVSASLLMLISNKHGFAASRLLPVTHLVSLGY